MPLINGYSHYSISKNIHKLIKEGYPENQAVAISMKKARDAFKNARVNKQLSKYDYLR